MRIDIPGRGSIEIKNIVFDFNGTIAEDGIIEEHVKEKIIKLIENKLDVYVLTSDTYGTALSQCCDLPIKVEIFSGGNASLEKGRIVEKLGGDSTISIGNGFNDSDMFKKSVLSIAIIGKEGCSIKALTFADIAVANPLDAIDIILNPDRIKATLRT